MAGSHRIGTSGDALPHAPADLWGMGKQATRRTEGEDQAKF